MRFNHQTWVQYLKQAPQAGTGPLALREMRIVPLLNSLATGTDILTHYLSFSLAHFQMQLFLHLLKSKWAVWSAFGRRNPKEEAGRPCTTQVVCPVRQNHPERTHSSSLTVIQRNKDKDPSNSYPAPTSRLRELQWRVQHSKISASPPESAWFYPHFAAGKWSESSSPGHNMHQMLEDLEGRGRESWGSCPVYRKEQVLPAS